MSAEAANKFWLVAAGILILIIIVSSLVVMLKPDGVQPIEISTPDQADFKGEVYIYGAVYFPGIYPLKAGDSIDKLVRASGGTLTEADISSINLYIPREGEEKAPQKVDLNRAEAWLLEALPDIGAGRAMDIIEYRRQNGSFHNTAEIMQVPGIGPSTFEKIKDLITVRD